MLGVLTRRINLVDFAVPTGRDTKSDLFELCQKQCYTQLD